MKVITTSILAAALLFAGGSAALAARNFRDMTNDELAALKSTMKHEPDETREAFRTEWQKRVAAMTPGELDRLGIAAGNGRDSTATNDDTDCD